LNNYVDQVTNGKPLTQQRLQFWTFNSDHLSTVEVTLPASGNLAALFYAFGLISEEDASTYQCAGPGLMQVHSPGLLCPCLCVACDCYAAAMMR